MARGLVPDTTGFGYFNFVNALLGMLVGWFHLGQRVGRGWLSAAGHGLTSAAVLLVVGILVQGGYEMVQRSLKRFYSGFFEAIGAIFSISADYALIIMAGPFLVTALIGGVLAGLLTEAANRRWV